ncbi:MAG: hypothetical protein PHE06_15630, partial [Lachnospiraceae bacterium]|nr:hypothetical protein [Lachnospiraceae bacterium]
MKFKKRITAGFCSALLVFSSSFCYAEELSPKDDFYRYATADELAAHPVDNETVYSEDDLPYEGWTVVRQHYLDIHKEEKQMLQEIMESDPGQMDPDSEELTIYKLAYGLQNKDLREAQGCDGLLDAIDRIMECENTEAFLPTLAEVYSQWGYSFLLTAKAVKKDNGQEFIPAFSFVSGSLAGFVDQATYDANKDAHIKLLQNLFIAAGYEQDEAMQMAQACTVGEQLLAQTSEEEQDDTITALSDLEERYPHLDLTGTLEILGAGEASELSITDQTDFLYALNASCAENENLYGLQCYAVSQLINFYSVYLSDEISAASEALNEQGETLMNESFANEDTQAEPGAKAESDTQAESGAAAVTGTIDQDTVEMVMPDLASAFHAQEELSFDELFYVLRADEIAHQEISDIYRSRHQDDEADQMIRDEVQKILDYYVDAVDKTEWLSDESKDAMKKKLDDIIVYIGTTESPALHSNSADTLVELIASSSKSKLQMEMKKLKDPEYYRSIWKMFAYADTVNASYKPELNAVIIP